MSDNLIGQIVLAVIGLVTTVIALRTKKQLQEVHLLVNERLDSALAHIARLENQLEVLAPGSKAADEPASDYLRSKASDDASKKDGP
jgi:hypothetical protein